MSPIRSASLALLVATLPCAATISVESGLPAGALISNPSGSNGTSTIGSGTTPVKGNSFILASHTSVTSVSFLVTGTSDVVGSITLDFFALSGTPDSTAGSGEVPTGASLYSQIEVLPAVTSGDYLRIALSSPLALPAGNYAFIISTSDADFNVRLNTDNAYTEGELIRQFSSNGTWQDRNNDLVFALEGTPTIPDPLGNPGAWPTTILEVAPQATPQSTQVSSTTPASQTFTLGSAVDLESVVLQLDDVTSSADLDGSLTLEIFPADGGGMPSGPILTTVAGVIPGSVGTGSFIEFSLDSALAMPAGDYVFALSSVDADIQLNATATDLVHGLTGTPHSRPPAAGGPNVVFILADDWGWTDHSVSALAKGNHSDFIQTPNLARLVNEGVAFTSAYAQPNCAPTRAALLTGQYSPRHGNGVYNVQSLNRPGGRTTYTIAANQGNEHANGDDQTITIAEAFYNSGYVTAHFGKYHAGASSESDPTFPLNQGFDYNFGGNNNGNPGDYIASGQQFGNKVGPELDPFAADYTADYIADKLTPYNNGNNPTALDGTAKHLTDAMADAFTSFMDDHRSGAMSAYPVYAQLHFYAVHGPITGRPDLVTKYNGLPAGNRHSKVGYAALVEGMDHSLGRVLDYLDDPNGDGDQSDSIADNTLLIFCSDNGGTAETNDPLRGEKGMHYEGGIRVPAVARMPNTIAAGKVSDTLIHVVDFYPTMLDFAGATYPDGTTHPLDGVSLHPHLLDPNNVARNRGPIFYHFPGYMDNRAYACSMMIKDVDNKRYKYIYAYDPYYQPGGTTTQGFDQYQLYNLTDDISETTNLLDYIDEENASDPDDPSTDEEYWNYLLYQDLGIQLATDLRNWLIGNPADTTWNPIYSTYSSNFPGIDPLLIGEETGPAPAALPNVETPFERSFRIIEEEIDVAAEEFTVTFSSAAGFLYDVQANSDLPDPGGWSTIGGNIHGQAGSTTAVISDPATATETTRLYRISLKPAP